MTRPIRTLAAAVATVLGAAAVLVAQTPPGPVPREAAAWQTVSVTGVGRVNLTPDRASFTVGVQTVAPSLGAATQENAARMTAIVAALHKAGATDRELRTTGLSIYPQQTAQEGKPPRVVGYQVSNNVTVTRDDVATVGRLLEAAVQAGANTVSGVSFSVSDPARGRDTGLQAAFAEAKAKADLLARAAGRSIGRALAITEGGAAMPPVPMPMYRHAEMAQAASFAAPVESGAEEIAFTVSVVFELQ
ncbi:MAG TPA: SIMPL domain-containing protein [Vicinamibacteria bacterium]|nr:SIMPL domain-containing protein [Vicinamibacteria bacterium]